MPSSYLPWTVPGEGVHPRIYFKPSDKSTLQARVASGGTHRAYWNDLQSYCAGHLSSANSYFSAGGRDAEATGAFAFSWYLSGNGNHGSKAVSVALYLASLNIPSGHDKRQYLLAMAMVYDWCYGLLSATQRATIRNRISDYIEVMYDVSDAEYLWGTSHGDVIYSMMGNAAVLADGSSSDNSRWVSRMDHGMDAHDDGSQLGFLPTFKYFGQNDGGSHKGIGPQSYYERNEEFYVRWFPAMRSAIGWDWYTEGQHWWRLGVNWLLWHLRMGASGDSTFFREQEGPQQSHFDRWSQAHALQIAQREGSSDYGRMCMWLVDLIDETDDETLDASTQIYNIVFRDTSISSLQPTIANTGGKQLKVFSKVAKLIWRSSWSESSVAMAVPAMKQFTGGHEQRRAGEIHLCGYGRRLLCRHGEYDAKQEEVPKVQGDAANSGHRYCYYGRILATSCVAILDSDEHVENPRDSTRRDLAASSTFGVKVGSTITWSNGGDQLWPKNANFTKRQPSSLVDMLAQPKWNFEGLAATPVENSQLAYAVVNLKPYYYAGKCSKYRRHFLWVKNGVIPTWLHSPAIMIWDDMTTVVDSVFGRKSQRFMLNANVKPTGSASSLVFTNSGARLFVRMLKPSVSVEFVEGAKDFAGVSFPSTNADPESDSNDGIWRTELTPAAATATPSFLSFMFLSPSSVGSPPSLSIVDDGTWIGATIDGVEVKVRVGTSFEASVDGSGSGTLTGTGTTTTGSTTTTRSTTRRSTTTIYVTQPPIPIAGPPGFPNANPQIDKPSSRLYLGGVDDKAPILAGLAASLRINLNEDEELQRWRIYSEEGFNKELAWERLETVDDSLPQRSIPVASILFGTDTDASPDGRRNFVEWTTNYGIQTRQLWVKNLPTTGSIYIANQEAQSAGATLRVGFGQPLTFSINILPNFADEFFRLHEYDGNRWSNTLRSWGGAFTAEIFLNGSLIIGERNVQNVHGYYWYTPVDGLNLVKVRLRASEGSPYYVDLTGKLTIDLS